MRDKKVFASEISRTINQPCGHRAVCDKPECLERYYGIRAVYLTEDQFRTLEQRNGGNSLFCHHCGDRVNAWDYGFAYEKTVGKTKIIMRNGKGIVKKKKKKEEGEIDGETTLEDVAIIVLGCLAFIVALAREL